MLHIRKFIYESVIKIFMVNSMSIHKHMHAHMYTHRHTHTTHTPLGDCHGSEKVLAHNNLVQSHGHLCQHMSSPRIPVPA